MQNIIDSISTPLPDGYTRQNACCFTGHRRIQSGYEDIICGLLDRVVTGLCQTSGVNYFICGGAIGFDTLAAEAVLRAKARGFDAYLILALPCIDQTKNWKQLDAIKRYKRIKAMADSLRYTGEFMSDDCMRRRNQYMVEHSSCCIAYCNRTTHRSGSVMTYNMATRAGLVILNLFDLIPVNNL